MRIVNLIKNESSLDKDIKKPYIIAEIGVNHEGSMDIAKRLINDAKEGGADAVKFQSYKAETLASKHSPAYWDTTKETTKSQFDLFKKHDKFWKNEMEKLMSYCKTIDIEFMSTPFDFESAKFLNEMMNVFKISSSDITNKPFIEFISSFNKPIILSTGASNLKEVEEAVSWIKSFNIPLSLLHCVLNYPTLDSNANLGMIRALQNAFPNNIIGYSDHTLPGKMKICEMAVMLGARIIEKHFTHDKSLPGNDHYHAMDKDDLMLFNSNMDSLLDILGSFQIQSLDSEKKARLNARRSIVAAKDIPKGKIIDREDLTFKRPAHGISPKFISALIGSCAKEDIKEDDIIIEDHIH